MRRKTVLALIAATLFVAIFTMEQVQATEPFNLINFCKDILEMALLAAAVTMTAFVSVQTREMRLERLELVEDLASSRRDSARWRDAARAHVSGLSRAIAAQFRTWGLTESEADVAALMLKGLTHKEIAALRKSSEATVRQHATMVYRKSNLTSRAQLTAFFLEDLLMPGDTAEPAERSVSLVSVRSGE